MLLCAALCCAVLLPASGCSALSEKAAAYKEAEALYESGEYGAAHDAFTQLGSYRDSDDRADECAYSFAMSAYKEGRYADAAEAFGMLGGYRDSHKYGTKCALISDPDRYIDEFAASVAKFLDDEGYDLRLAEAENADHPEGHRSFFLTPGGARPGDDAYHGVAVSFIRVDSGGNLWGDGQVNAVMVYGNPGGSADDITDGFTKAMIAGSKASYSVFAGGQDLKAYEKKLRSELSDAEKSVGEDQPVIRSERQYNGFDIRTVVSKDSGGIAIAEMISVSDKQG